MQSTNGEFGHFVETDVVGDRTNNDGCFILTTCATEVFVKSVKVSRETRLTFLVHVSNETRQRERWSVGLRHEQSLEDDLVEFRSGTSCQESIEFDEQEQVKILRVRRSADGFTVETMVKIDTHVNGRVS